MEKIKIGKIVNAVALKGEVKVYSYSDYKERFEEIDRVILSDGREFKIENVRYQQQMVILKLSGVNDRNGAEALKTKDVYITEEDLLELPSDTFYIRDLVGLTVKDADSGAILGKLKEVLQPSSQDVYVVELAAGGQMMVPAVSAFIREISLQEGIISVHLIEGMLPQ